MVQIRVAAAIALLAGSVACADGGGDKGPARVVPVRATDSLRFEPAALSVRAGERITFEVHNAGSGDHELVVGDEAFHAEHAKGASEGHHGDDGVRVAPGNTERFTYRFREPGTLIYACHIDRHYAAGMKGTVSVG